MHSIRSIISEQLGLDDEEITAETSFVNDLGADSLDTTELIMELEEEFNFSISPEEAEQLRTVGDVIRFLQNREIGGIEP